MEIVYARGLVSAADVQESLPDAPGYSAVRSALRLLEQKGFLLHRRQGARYVFEATVPGDHARQSALRRLVATFFRNSALEAVQTILSDRELRLKDEEIAELEELVRQAKSKRRQ